MWDCPSFLYEFFIDQYINFILEKILKQGISINM